MAPPGTRVIVHEKRGNRTSWGHHGTLVWYIGPSLDHYRCMQFYMPATSIVRITDTLQYTPKAFASPNTEDFLQQAIRDIIAITKKPPNTLPFFSFGDTTKMRSIRFPTSCTEAYLNHVNKFYPCRHCYHRLGVKIFNFRISPSIPVPAPRVQPVLQPPRVKLL